jgi:hypothetical protein
MPMVGIPSRNPASPRSASIDQCSFGAPGLDGIADVLERQVERRLMQLLNELAGVGFVARGCMLVMNCQAHIVSLPFKQCVAARFRGDDAQSVTANQRPCRSSLVSPLDGLVRLSDKIERVINQLPKILTNLTFDLSCLLGISF